MYETALEQLPRSISARNYGRKTKSRSVQLVSTLAGSDGSLVTISYTISVTVSKVSL